MKFGPVSVDDAFIDRTGSIISVRPGTRRYLTLAIGSLLFVWWLSLFGPTEMITNSVPTVRFNYHPNRPPPSPFNETKVALLIETRPAGQLAPMTLHMMSVLPNDWRFLFIGSEASLELMNASIPIQLHQRNGKLDLQLLPENVTLLTQEDISRLMTDLWFYETQIGKAEWLLVFQTDSIMCANSEESLNDWLEYDWVGAPWNPNDRFGGNGGLSLRRVSKIKQVLSFQQRIPGTEPEDLWLINRIGLLPGAKMANGTTEQRFSVEAIWHPSPMGFHLGWGGNRLPEGVWDSEEHRKQIYDHCPEIKMIMRMALEREKCTPEPTKVPEPDINGSPAKIKREAKTEDDMLQHVRLF